MPLMLPAPPVPLMLMAPPPRLLLCAARDSSRSSDLEAEISKHGELGILNERLTFKASLSMGGTSALSAVSQEHEANLILYKFRSNDRLKYTLDILERGLLYCARIESLNDPMEGWCWLEANGHIAIKVFGRTISSSICHVSEAVLNGPKFPRICSLSASFDDIRMWSHYANGHAGIAIGIRMFNSPKLRAVSYGESPPMWRCADASDVLTWKTVEWDYEKEYRILHHEEFFCVRDLIVEILLGVRCSEEAKRAIISAAPKGVNVFTTQIDRHARKVVRAERIL